MFYEIKTQIEGKPAELVISDRYRRSAPIHDLPRLASFRIYCRHDPGDQLHHPAERASLDAIGENLIKFCRPFAEGSAVFAMRIDTRGIREYCLYCGRSASERRCQACA